MEDEDGNPILCSWCGSDDPYYTDCTDWACRTCAEENKLNTKRPEINGFSRWIR